MAEKLDVAARLAEGQPAVEDVQTLVWASHLVGYQNPDLTSDAGQVRQWYASEDGLNLRVLEGDCAALDRAVAATREALRLQQDQVAALSAAWHGDGADASLDFLRRHADVSAVAAAGVSAAAEALAALRDELWRLIDAKVDATSAVADRIAAQRAEWLAAAQTVTTGAGDRAAASELIDQQVKAFVDNDIGGDWLTAMRSTEESVADAYDAATMELSDERDAVFDVPGHLGPAWPPTSGDDAVATTPAAAGAQAPSAGAPSSWDPPVWNAPSAPPPMPAPAPSPAAPAATEAAAAPALTPAPAPAQPAMPSAPSLGGLPDIGGGLSGFGRQLADMLGGLLGSGDAEGLADPPDLDPPDLKDDDPVDDSIDDEESADDEKPVDDATDPADVDDKDDACTAEPAGDLVPDEPAPVEELAAPASTPVPEPSVAPPAPLAPPEPATTAGTPCEIAADELPQVGE